MVLTFKYKKIKDPDLKKTKSIPKIPVTLKGRNNKKIEQLMLLDSGADKTTLPMQFAIYLNLDLSSDPENLFGLSGINNPVKAIPSKVEIEIKDEIGNSGEKYTIKNLPVYIAIDEKIGCILLGREKFFRVFDIFFKERKGLILLYPKTNPQARK